MKFCVFLFLSGITNDSKDPSVDTFRSTTLPILKRFGVPSEGLDLKIESRGVPPHGGGEVILSVPVVQKSLNVSFFMLILLKFCCSCTDGIPGSVSISFFRFLLPKKARQKISSFKGCIILLFWHFFPLISNVLCYRQFLGWMRGW